MVDKFEPELYERFRDLSNALELLKKSMGDDKVTEALRGIHEINVIHRVTHLVPSRCNVKMYTEENEDDLCPDGYLCPDGCLCPEGCKNIFETKTLFCENIDASVYYIWSVINSELLFQYCAVDKKKNDDNMVEVSDLNRIEELEINANKCKNLIVDFDLCNKLYGGNKIVK